MKSSSKHMYYLRRNTRHNGAIRFFEKKIDACVMSRLIKQGLMGVVTMGYDTTTTLLLADSGKPELRPEYRDNRRHLALPISNRLECPPAAGLRSEMCPL